jgi:hypothetical protein
METVPPCTCVVGVTTRAQARAIAESVPHDARQRIMLAVLASPETLEGRPLPSPHYAARGQIADIFLHEQKNQHAINAIQLRGWRPSRLFRHLSLAENAGGDHLDLIQLETSDTWPDPAHVRQWVSLERRRSLRPTLGLVVSARLASRKGGGTPHEVATRISRYAELGDLATGSKVLTHVIIELSSRDGRPNRQERSIANALRERPSTRDLSVGFAGGIGPKTIAPIALYALRRGVSVTVKALSAVSDEKGMNVSLATRFVAAVEESLAHARARREKSYADRERHLRERQAKPRRWPWHTGKKKKTAAT